jgi:hypothetical protein
LGKKTIYGWTLVRHIRDILSIKFTPVAPFQLDSREFRNLKT